MKIGSPLLGLAALFASLSPAVSQDVRPPSPVATGDDLLAEMQRLHEALGRVQELLIQAEIPADDVIMSQAAKLVRRVRSLVYATRGEVGRPTTRRQQEIGERLRRVRNEDAVRARVRRRQVQRRIQKMRQTGEDPGTVRVGDIADGVVRGGEEEDVVEGRALLRGAVGATEAEGMTEAEEEEIAFERVMREGGADEVVDERVLRDPAMEDEVARRAYEATITFPECNEKLLEDCLAILSRELAQLEMDCQYIINEKRNSSQEGYNKVVIITDLTASTVKGKLNDGRVEYPFPWDDAVEGYPRMLGVNGVWNCHAMTPDECCAKIQEEVPNPDTRGNYIMCHIFVPFGGVGNRKRNDRVFINLSPDGRVHEPPKIA